MLTIRNLVERKRVENEGVPPFCLAFYVLESMVELDGETFGTYGIQVDKLNSDESEILESEKVLDIDAEKSEVEKFAQILCDGDVEPVILNYLVEDFVGV